MTRLRFLFCLILCCLLRVFAYGQVDNTLDQLRTVVPPSPNASSLGKFGEWPVSLYTGIPSIDIPIYTLKSRNLKVPISLDYHAAGNRVGEIASWVGLGWSLNAGGCISRTVRGLPDDEGYFTTASNFTDANNFSSVPISTTQNYENIAAAENGNVDVEQDVYNLNALGRSYRIYFRSDSTAYTMPASNIKISKNYLTSGNGSWTVILEDGTKLLFGGGTSYAQPYTEQTSNVDFGSEDLGDSYISAWYLQSITAPTGETITFTYTQSYITQDTHFTQSDNLMYFYTAIHAGEYDDPPFQPYNEISSKVSLQTVNQLSLSTIQSDQATVYFIPSDSNRQDLPGGESLTEIKVHSNLTNSYVGDWVFNYSYSTCASGNELNIGSGPAQSYYHYRLKLTSLSHNALDGSQPEVWSFTYNPLSLPSRRSFAQDYNGFYNGATGNNSLLVTVPLNPTVCPLVVNNYGPWAFSNIGFINSLGDNHTPSEQYMQAEMLTNITYPTGGSTAFTYEGNGITTSQELFVDTTATLNINAVGGGEGPVVDTVIFTFTLTKPEYVHLNMSSTISQPILSDFPGAKVFGWILDNHGNIVNSFVGSGSAWVNIYQSGTYTLHLFCNFGQDEFFDGTTYVNATMSMNYYSSHGFQNLKQELGGLRINNIQSYDGISSTPILSRYFVYDSAFVINPVDTVNSYITTQGDVLLPNEDGSQYEYMKVTRNCATKFSLGSIQGGTVGYGKVTTYDGLNGANGYTVSSFSCDPQTQAGLPASLVFPYPPNDIYEWRNGLLLSEIIYTASGQAVKATKNSYNFVRRARIVNFGDGMATINALNLCGGLGDYGGCGAVTVDYSNTNEQVEHTSQTEILYDLSSGNELSKTTTYYYDDTLNMQPTRTVYVDSKSDSVLVYTRSPFELSAINSSIPLSGPATAALDTMIARNIVGQAIETERYVAGNLSYKALTNYQLTPAGLVLPANIMLQNSTNPIETRVNFLEYDNYGNLLEQAKTNNENHNYIYDYSNNYPIAEIVNGDSTSIAYTSFESNGTGGWMLSGGTVDTTKGFTGTKSYTSSFTITKGGLNSANTYVLSYWTTAALPLTVAGIVSGYPIQGKTIFINGNNWTYYEYKITGISTASVSGSGSANVDELRLYPASAQMTTYTYVPLVGVSSVCDVDNRVTYYQYDGLNRLKVIKDQDGNILKTIQYHYMNQ
jgi:YD repeat-containing protein